MDSINRNQPEKNHEDLQTGVAIDKIKEIVGDAPNGFFSTADGATRPMNVRKTDDAGDLWFLSANDSRKNAAIAADPAVRLFFQSSKNSGFLVLDGQATVTTEKAKIKELWSPILATWFTGGVDDPRISVIRFVPTGGYYWDTKHGNAVAGVKMLIGAAIGKTLDDSIEGRIEV